jgi:transmembrane sensor
LLPGLEILSYEPAYKYIDQKYFYLNSMNPGQKEQYSDEQANRIAYLVAGYIRNTLSEKERDELDEWICASDENMQLFEKLTDERNIEKGIKWMESVNTEQALKKTKQSINFNETSTKRIWKRLLPYAVAASVIIIAGILILNSVGKKTDSNGIIRTTDADILPGSNNATLTFQDGKTITLATGSNDTSINEQIKILRQKGEIVYTKKETNEPMAYHTLTIPRGGQYKLTLPDGTKVWMNSESSIRYPVAFDEGERKVFITGEAYFEVAKDKKKPFRVVVNEIIVEALGTAFNINAYSNEPFFSATLVEGSILVSNGKTENMLKPGQQAKISATVYKIDVVETNDIIAWKNNLFRFTNTSLDEIMRQVERWYDTEVVYESAPPDHFNLTDVSRDVPVSKLLHVLELTKRVHFKIENNKITVMK